MDINETNNKDQKETSRHSPQWVMWQDLRLLRVTNSHCMELSGWKHGIGPGMVDFRVQMSRQKDY